MVLCLPVFEFRFQTQSKYKHAKLDILAPELRPPKNAKCHFGFWPSNTKALYDVITKQWLKTKPASILVKGKPEIKALIKPPTDS